MAAANRSARGRPESKPCGTHRVEQCLRFGGQIAMSNPGISKIEFAADSPLEEAVTSELVSEGQIPC
jgi:hypothetical protein